jgi:hypothetical protein
VAAGRVVVMSATMEAAMAAALATDDLRRPA